MKSHNLLDRNKAQLLVIDLQEKLVGAIHGIDDVLHRTAYMIEFAKLLDLPITVTEQNPAGLGGTIDAITNAMGDVEPIGKMTFSSYRTDAVRQRLVAMDRPQVILVGVETQVCILQTTMDLIQVDFDVFVCADAVGSRKTDDHRLALDRIANAGATICTTEMAAYEMLDHAGDNEFRAALAIVKKYG